MKGIILAGGSGSRLHPLTLAISKQLMPIYDKPMIYYPLSVLMMANIKEILIISTPYDLPNFKKILGDGKKLGCEFSYAEQKEPNGLAQAFVIGEDFIGQDDVALILGDNIFFGENLQELLLSSTKPKGGVVFAYYVSDPERYGVVEFDDQFKAISIEEKPTKPKSNYVVPGLYFYNNSVVEIAKSIKPSKRGEYEITGILNQYIKIKQLNFTTLGRGHAWLDMGTHENLLKASQFVETIEQRQGLKIACLEEIALINRWINTDMIKKQIKDLHENDYVKYLKKIIYKNS